MPTEIVERRIKRRKRVLELHPTGMSQLEMAKKLGEPLTTIHRDWVALKLPCTHDYRGAEVSNSVHRAFTDGLTKDVRTAIQRACAVEVLRFASLRMLTSAVLTRGQLRKLLAQMVSLNLLTTEYCKSGKLKRPECHWKAK